MKKFTVILPLIFITFFTAIGHAAKIINVKGNKVLIDLESSRILIGETALVVDSSEKEVAQLKVVQIKGNRAIAEVLQGHVTLNLQVVKKNVSVAPQDGEDLLDGWYFGLGYDFAKPYISVQVGSQRSPVFVELTYQPAAFFSIGYEKVSFQKLGFIFSYIKESNSPLSQQSVTGSSASFASSSVDGLSLELGMTYGDSIKNLPFFFLISLTRTGFSFNLPGFDSFGGSMFGVKAGVSAIFHKNITLDFSYRSASQSGSSDGSTAKITYSGPQVQVAYVF